MRRLVAVLILFSVFIPVVSAQSTDCVPAPAASIPITPENAAQLRQIDTIGRGYHYNILWQGDEILTRAESGWWRTNADLSVEIGNEPCRVFMPTADIVELPEAAPDPIWNQIPADERDFTNVLGVSPSGNIWLTITTIWASDRSRTEVWNADGTLLHTLPTGGWRPYMNAAFNADESQVAILSADGAITIYDVATGAGVNYSGGWGGYSVVMAVSPGGNEIVLGNEEIARIWLLDRSIYGASLPGTYSAAFMPDGTIALPQDNAIRFYTVTDGREVRSLSMTFPMYGTEIAVSPNGNWIALAHPETGWSVIDAQTGSTVVSGTVQPIEGSLNMVDVDITDTHVAIGEIDMLHVISLNNPTEVRDLPNAGYPALGFSPDGQFLATNSLDALVKLYDVNDLANPRPLGEFGTAVSDIVFSPDGRLIAVKGGGQLQLLDAATGETRFSGEAFFGSLEFTLDGTRIVMGEWQCYLCGSDETAQISAAQVWGIVPD